MQPAYFYPRHVAVATYFIAVATCLIAIATCFFFVCSGTNNSKKKAYAIRDEILYYLQIIGQ